MTKSADPYRALADALRERLTLVADRELYQRDPTAHLAQLQMISGKITTLAARLPANIDPQLAHYLQRSSYDKALAFIEAR